MGDGDPGFDEQEEEDDSANTEDMWEPWDDMPVPEGATDYPWQLHEGHRALRHMFLCLLYRSASFTGGTPLKHSFRGGTPLKEPPMHTAKKKSGSAGGVAGSSIGSMGSAETVTVGCLIAGKVARKMQPPGSEGRSGEEPSMAGGNWDPGLRRHSRPSTLMLIGKKLECKKKKKDETDNKKIY